MDKHEELIERLRALSAEPLDATTRARVLERIRTSKRSWLSASRLKIGGAAAAGFLFGSLGFASAGALRAPAQDVAHSVLGSVGLGCPWPHPVQRSRSVPGRALRQTTVPTYEPTRATPMPGRPRAANRCNRSTPPSQPTSEVVSEVLAGQLPAEPPQRQRPGFVGLGASSSGRRASEADEMLAEGFGRD
jgi:hypothetical protein